MFQALVTAITIPSRAVAWQVHSLHYRSIQRLDLRVVGELPHRGDFVGEEFSILFGAHRRRLVAHPQQLRPHYGKAKRLSDGTIELIDNVTRRVRRRGETAPVKVGADRVTRFRERL